MNSKGRPNYDNTTHLTYTQLANWTAPSNGYLFGWVRCEDNQLIDLSINGTAFDQTVANGYYMHMALPFFFVVSSGDNFKFTAGANHQNTTAWFAPEI